MRELFSNFITELAKKDRRVRVLTGDHGYALFDKLRRECPDQYLNCGVAEQSMVGVAAGLARAGLRPIVYGLAAFIPIRVMEQIKLDVAHDRLPVTFIGDGAGFVYSHLGTSHQCCEDIACARSIPNLEVYSPCDASELALVMQDTYSRAVPSYIRLGKADLGAVHDTALTSGIMEPIAITDAVDAELALIATGSMVVTACNIAKEFPNSVSVYSLPTIKPLANQALADIAQRHKAIVTLEEHSVFAGMGSAVCEALSEVVFKPVKRIGINDRFSESCGDYAHLRTEHGLDEISVRQAVVDFAQTHGVVLTL